MPWQQYVADVALEVDEEGLFYYKSVGVGTPRQSGKTTLFGSVMEHRALTVKKARVWFTQQSGKDAVDWLLNEHYPQLAPLSSGFHLRRAAGSEHIRWHNTGGLVRPFPPKRDGLHSKVSDLVVIDEPWAFDLVKGREVDGAIVPTQATRPNAQTWKVSTAGDATSTWWLSTVEAGRAAALADRRDGVAYFEWSCPDHLDTCDPVTWPIYHPAYGRTVGERAMRAALEELGPDEFARAYGNRWVATTSRVIPAAAWLAAGDAAQALPAPGGLVLAFDVALDRSDAAILAGWTDPAGIHRLEVVDWRPTSGWVVERMVELKDKWQPRGIGYDAAGPALDLADALERKGLTLTGTKSHEYAAACASLLEGLIAEPPTIRYRPHQALDDAAAAATRRALGDAWAWGRRQSSISLSALTAATVARWIDDHTAPPPGPFRIY
jgi:hypothetical protein